MKKILCVDDDAGLLHLYQEELSEEGYEVILAKDGKEAMEKFKEEMPEAVVLDIRMPVMDGIETLNAILGKDRQTPIILNTAFPQYRENFMAWAAEAYVIKSSDLTELKQKIREVLDKRNNLKNLDPKGGQHFREQFMDITVSKRTGKARADRTVQLKRMNRELVALNAELDDFTNLASHDLQEPLRILTTFSDLLRKDMGNSLPNGAAQDLGFITDAAKRMERLIRDLLALTRAGRAAKKREKVSLSECANRALEALVMRVKETGAEVTQDELPRVSGDSTLITELYQNLIGNALKFRGDQRPIIRLTVEEREDEQVFGVKDNGIGIEPKYAQQIFRPFRRLHGRAEYEGSGIGLAICRKIVERHGGKIWVESEPGKGSHFRFTISHAKRERCGQRTRGTLSSSFWLRMTGATRS
ncbi:MAG: ATP-binding protein [Thermodesulfobacteriota bacterium]|jgi:signal transduction histidine kinase